MLAGEIKQLTSVGLSTGQRGPQGAVTVAGGDYKSVASGEATLVQWLRSDNGALTIPQAMIADASDKLAGEL